MVRHPHVRACACGAQCLPCRSIFLKPRTPRGGDTSHQWCSTPPSGARLETPISEFPMKSTLSMVSESEHKAAGEWVSGSYERYSKQAIGFTEALVCHTALSSVDRSMDPSTRAFIRSTEYGYHNKDTIHQPASMYSVRSSEINFRVPWPCAGTGAMKMLR